MKENNKTHWEQVYQRKGSEQVSWTQAVPQTSLDFIHGFNLSKDASIIDIGGGDSKLVDFLLQEGYQDITVLDISEAALKKAKLRLGMKADSVKWIVSDITEFQPEERYDLWHDRATFHFLTTTQQISAYLETAGSAVGQYLVVGTFSDNGPDKCSGLPVKQYSEIELQQTLSKDFQKIECITEDHPTPFNTLQNFVFCSFEKV
jgi:hypothetical protein